MDKDIALSLIEHQAFHQEQSLAIAYKKGKEWHQVEAALQKRVAGYTREIPTTQPKQRKTKKETARIKAKERREADWEAGRAFRYALVAEKKARTMARFYKLDARDKKPGRRATIGGQEYRLLIDLIKTAAVCTDCGKDWEPVALGFDHLPERGAKLFSISTGSNRSVGVLMAEMAKCEIVCHACHAIRTNNRIKAKKQAA